MPAIACRTHNYRNNIAMNMHLICPHSNVKAILTFEWGIFSRTNDSLMIYLACKLKPTSRRFTQSNHNFTKENRYENYKTRLFPVAGSGPAFLCTASDHFRSLCLAQHFILSYMCHDQSRQNSCLSGQCPYHARDLLSSPQL